MKDWLNGYPNYELCNFQKNRGPGPACIERRLQPNVRRLVRTFRCPDLNQKNPYVANYLIENSIWWIEYAGLSGIRMDTYSFPDMHMMARWTCRIMKRISQISILSEKNGTLHPPSFSYWQRGKKKSERLQIMSSQPDGFPHPGCTHQVAYRQQLDAALRDTGHGLFVPGSGQPRGFCRQPRYRTFLLEHR